MVLTYAITSSSLVVIFVPVAFGVVVLVVLRWPGPASDQEQNKSETTEQKEEGDGSLKQFSRKFQERHALIMKGIG